MDIRNHLNLINNHNYDGYIAIYTGPNQVSTRTGDIVLVENSEDTELATIESPMSEEEIEKQKAKGNRLTTNSCCVCVPVNCLEKIII